MVVAEMTGSEKFEGLIGKALVMVENLLWSVQGGRAIGCDIQLLSRIFRQRHDTEVFARDYRGIDEGGERSDLKVDFARGLGSDWQGSGKLPSPGQLQARLIAEFIGRPTRRIQQ